MDKLTTRSYHGCSGEGTHICEKLTNIGTFHVWPHIQITSIIKLKVGK